MGYAVFPSNKQHGPRVGLEGPFEYPNGRVLYYDPIEGSYWDPLTDFFVGREEIDGLQAMMTTFIANGGV